MTAVPIRGLAISPRKGFRRFSVNRANRKGGIMAEPLEAGNGKPRKRHPAKTATGQVSGKVKATIHLSGEADKRLSVHATMMEMDRSELVELLIYQHLRRFVVSDRGGPDGAGGGEAAA
jgi:hypothetical protein